MALILVVDDEPAVRRLLVRWLSAEGHETMEAGDADAALEVMGKQPAAVVFCDVQMPGHDGLWLMRELRERFPHVAIVLATGAATVPPAVSMRAGVLAYLVKPFSQPVVLQSLDTALKWHDAALVSGPHREDSADRVQAWLDSLEP